MRSAIKFAGMVVAVVFSLMARTEALPPPVAGFMANPTNGFAPLTVDFADTSSGLITSWSWNFGDGVTTNLTFEVPDLFHAYDNPGTYDVELTVSGPGGMSTLDEPGLITVIPEPGTWLLVGFGLLAVAVMRR